MYCNAHSCPLIRAFHTSPHFVQAGKGAAGAGGAAGGLQSALGVWGAAGAGAGAGPRERSTVEAAGQLAGSGDGREDTSQVGVVATKRTRDLGVRVVGIEGGLLQGQELVLGKESGVRRKRRGCWRPVIVAGRTLAR